MNLRPHPRRPLEYRPHRQHWCTRQDHPYPRTHNNLSINTIMYFPSSIVMAVYIKQLRVFCMSIHVKCVYGKGSLCQKLWRPLPCSGALLASYPPVLYCVQIVSDLLQQHMCSDQVIGGEGPSIWCRLAGMERGGGGCGGSTGATLVGKMTSNEEGELILERSVGNIRCKVSKCIL